MNKVFKTVIEYNSFLLDFGTGETINRDYLYNKVFVQFFHKNIVKFVAFIIFIMGAIAFLIPIIFIFNFFLIILGIASFHDVDFSGLLAVFPYFLFAYILLFIFYMKSKKQYNKNKKHCV